MGASEQYEEFLEQLEERGFPSPKILVPALAILVVLAIAFLALPLLPGSAGGARKITLQVQDAGGTGVPGATVTLLTADGKKVDSSVSDSAGFASFNSAPAGELHARTEAAGHKLDETTLSSESNGGTVTLESENALAKVSRVQVAVVDADSLPIAGAIVRLSTPTGDRSGVTDATGHAEIGSDRLPDTASADTQRTGYDDGVLSGITKLELQSAADSPIRIVLRKPEPTPAAMATVRATILSPTGAPASGILVTLVDSLGVTAGSAQSSQGAALFEQVDRGKTYFIRASDAKGAFEAFESAAFSVDSNYKELTVQLRRKAVEKAYGIAVAVEAAGGTPVPEAQVSLYSRATNARVDMKFTDESGTALFDASATESYYATAFAESYLPGFKASAKTGDSFTITLEEQAAGNFADATVQVTADGEPASGAIITLISRGGSRNGFSVGLPTLYAGPDGIARAIVPTKLDSAGYKLVALATLGDKAGESDGVAVVQQGTVLKVQLKYPQAFVRAIAIDKLSGRNVSNGLAQAFTNGSAATSCITDATGTCTMTLDAGRPYTFTFGAPGYIDLTTTPRTFAASERAALKAELYSEADLKAVAAEFLGVFDALGNRVLEIDNAQSYKARFRLSAQQGNTLAGIYFRVGSGVDVAQNEAAITRIYAPGATLAGYGPTIAPQGCDVSANGSTQSIAAKWAEAAYPAGITETKDIEFTFRVKNDVPGGVRLAIEYRAYAYKEGVPMLYPLDKARAALLLNKVQARQQITPADFCGSSLENTGLRVTSRPLACDASGVCTRFSFADAKGLSGGNGFPVELGKEFTLQFTIISPLGIDYAGIAAPSAQVLGFDYNTTSSFSGLPLSTLQLAEPGATVEQALSISASPGERVDGTVRLKATQPAVRAPVDFFIHVPGGDARRAPLFVRVTGTNAFTPRVQFAELVLGIDSSERITVVDKLGKPVTGATLTMTECDGAPLGGNEIVVAGDGSTNRGRSGVYLVALKPSALGKIGLRLEHPDFETFESCGISVIAGNFITADPNALGFSGLSTPQQALPVHIASTLPMQSRVGTAVRCSVGGSFVQSTLLSVEPAQFSLDSTDVDVSVKLQQGARASTECIIMFSATAGSARAYAIVGALVNVTSPPTPAETYPQVPSSIRLLVDETGVAQAFYYIGDLGQVRGCRFAPSGSNPIDEAALQMQCGGEVLSLAVSYDFATQCLPAAGATGRIFVSRTLNGLPQPDAAIGLVLVPGAGAKVCNAASATPTPTPTGGATPTPAPSISPTPIPNGYPVLPSRLDLYLDDFAFAEGYYSLENVPGPISGCELRATGGTGADSITNFVRLDTNACANGYLHVVADYAGFPTPPGLYKSLKQNAQVRLLRPGNTAQTRDLTVSASRMANIPDGPAACGDGVCETARGEDGASCTADCPLVASCSDGITNGNEAGVDCGGGCARNCSYSGYPQVPATISIKLNDEGLARKSYSLKPVIDAGCKPASCEVRASYLDSQNPLTALPNFVSVDSALCSQGVAQISADYATFQNLYRTYVGTGTLYVQCADASFVTRPMRVSAQDMAGLPDDPATCTDGVKNQREANVDCGGPCSACPAAPTCTDGVKNGNETGVDCGSQCGICAESLYEALPNEITLYLNNDRFAEATYHAKLLSAKPVSCSQLRPAGFFEEQEPATLLTNYVTLDCSGGIVHATADYAGFPTELLWRGMVQGGSFQVSFEPIAGSGASGGVSSGAQAGPMLKKTIRVIVSAANIAGGQLSRPVTGIDSLPGTIVLNVYSQQNVQAGQFGGSAFGIDTGNQRTIKVNFLREPECQMQGFLGAGAGGQWGGGIPGMPYAAPQIAFQPQAYWQGQPLSDAASILYPPDVPESCRVPKVLTNPELCPICQQYLPGFDYFEPGAFSKQSAAEQRPALQTQYPWVAGGNPNYGFNQQYGGFGGYSGQQGGLGNYYGGGFGGQQYGFGGGFGQSQFGAAGGFGSFGSVSQPINPIAVGFPNGLPPGCQLPSVCGNPTACQLSYCTGLVVGGRAALQAAGSQVQMQPPTVSCSRSEITVAANYFGTAATSGFSQANTLKVSETTPSGKVRTKNVQVLINVINAFGQSAGQSQSLQPMWCRQPIAGLAKGQVIRVSDYDVEKTGVPKSVEIKLNPLTLKGEYSTTIPVKSPDGTAIPFLCDKSQLETSLKGKPTADVECGDNGRLRIALDYTGRDAATQWQSEADYPQSISDSGSLRVKLTSAGPTLEFNVAVKVVADDFSPTQIALLVDSRTGKAVKNSESDYKASTKLSTHMLKPTMASAEAISASANGNSIFIDAAFKPGSDLSPAKGSLLLATRPKRQIDIYAAQVPSKMLITLKKAGDSVAIDKCFDGSTKGKGWAPEGDGDTCAYRFYPTAASLPVGCRFDSQKSVSTRPSGDQFATEVILFDHGGPTCNAGKGIFLKLDPEAVLEIMRQTPATPLDLLKLPFQVTLQVGDDPATVVSYTIRGMALGLKASAYSTPSDAELTLKAPLAGNDFDEEGIGIATATLATASKTTKAPNPIKAGRKPYIGVKFPKIIDPGTAGMRVLSEEGMVLFAYGTFKCGEGCKTLTEPAEAVGEDGVYYFKIPLGKLGAYTIETAARVSGKKLSAKVQLQVGTDDEIDKQNEKNKPKDLQTKKIGEHAVGPAAPAAPAKSTTPKGKKPLKTVGFG